MDFDKSDFENVEAIKKNSLEYIRVFRHEYMGTPLVSIRLFNCKCFPSHKGISLQPEHWKQVLPLLKKLLAEAGEEAALINDQ